MMNKDMKSGLLGLVSVIIVGGAATLGNFATMPSIPTWYAALNKPPFNPPNWIFGPVWTLLFLLLAFSFWRILRAEMPDATKRNAIMAFLAQMILNPLWSIVFFYLHMPAWALLVVILLEASILNMIRIFARIDRLAANLQWPYVAWVAFATILNFSVVILN